MGNKPGKPILPDVATLIQAGINPKTGLPIKLGGNIKSTKPDILKLLRIVDEQDAVNRGCFYNIPADISSQEFMRMLYFKYQLILWYCKELETFMITPFTLCSEGDGLGVDYLGRYTYVRPVPFVGGATDDKKRPKTPVEILMSKKCLKVRYTPIPFEDLTLEDYENSAVIFRDYTPQLATNEAIPRSVLNEPVLDVMAECIPLLRTNLTLSSGTRGVRVGDADQAPAVADANRSIREAALVGDAYIPIVGALEMQELTGGGVIKVQDFLLAMQSLDNFRLSLYGIDNGGLFEKKAHELQSEADVNGGNIGLVMQDDIAQKQWSCVIANSIWGIGIWYEPSETISKADMNGDGMQYDRETPEKTGQETGGTDNGSDNV